LQWKRIGAVRVLPAPYSGLSADLERDQLE
jgi:hypothetical protein